VPSVDLQRLVPATARVLVTGGLGFIGSRLCETLDSLGADVRALDSAWFNGVPLDSAAQQEVARRRTRIGANLVEVDLNDEPALAHTLADLAPTHVVHLAALSRADIAARDPTLAMRANVDATDALLRCLRAGAPRRTLRRIVHVSSSMVYGNFSAPIASESHPTLPIEPYGTSKLEGERRAIAWSQRAGVECVVVRPSAVYGPGDFNGRVPQRFVEAAAQGRPLRILGDATARLDFTYVDDVVDGLVRTLFVPSAAARTFNLTAGKGRSLAELAGIVASFGTNVRVEVGAQCNDGRPRRGTLAIDSARALLGFSPRVSLEDGIRAMFDALGATDARPK